MISKWNHACSHFPHMNMSILFIIKVKTLWSYKSPPPNLCRLLKLPLVDKFTARGPISLKHMSLWCLFLDPHLTQHYSKIGVQLGEVTELGMHISRQTNLERQPHINWSSNGLQQRSESTMKWVEVDMSLPIPIFWCKMAQYSPSTKTLDIMLRINKMACWLGT